VNEFLLVCLLALIVSFVTLLVYVVRLTLRVITMWAAVVFYQAPGTNGDVISLAAKMFTYVVRGKR
jgi:sugar phosphate permease